MYRRSPLIAWASVNNPLSAVTSTGIVAVHTKRDVTLRMARGNKEPAVLLEHIAHVGADADSHGTVVRASLHSCDMALPESW